MADITYSKRASDRREGRQIRSLPAYSRIAPYILRRRSDAVCYLSDSVEVTGIEQWLRDKRGEGWSGLGFLHLLVCAYVRTVSMRPGINRFISGRRLFARNDIQVILPVKRSPSVSATETCIKVSFSPSDTVFDVYRRLTAAIDEVKERKAKFILAVGGGSKIDISKMVAKECKIPFISIPTSAAHDGIASGRASLRFKVR